MKNFKSTTLVKEVFTDYLTPIGMYGRLRNLFPHSMLLESSDYLPGENCFSYIGINPVSSFKLIDQNIYIEYPDQTAETIELENKLDLVSNLENYFSTFQVDTPSEFKFISNGLYGYLAYDAVEFFDSIKFKPRKQLIPTVYYQAYEFVIAINHYLNKIFILKNTFHEASASGYSIEDLLEHIATSQPSFGDFKVTSDTSSNMKEKEQIAIIENCKQHIQRGDVFQIVPSRSFTQSFLGDDFQVYRALRSINPSPYLFFYDFGNFRIIGSSPEAELIIKDNRAIIHPIAGTCPRLEDCDANNKLIEQLLADPKENSEHVMLVDLARNDLNKHCRNVQVDSYREVQKFSHVNHLVSIVSGEVEQDTSPFRLLADTFPAGTLSGAPKFRAMELIDHFEPDARDYYGGAIGIVDFNGQLNHAIMIRTFLSKDGMLYRRAGGGIVSESQASKEVEEVNNKLMALEKALVLAEEL